MTQEKNDLRVKRTQKMLQEALIDLVAERSFDTISVGDIAERAMVNRATFYRHYQDKYGLMENIFADTLNQMIETIGQPKIPVNKIDFSKTPTLTKLFEHVDQHHKLYEIMLGPRGNLLFTLKLRDQIMIVVQEREKLREKTLPQQESFMSGNKPPSDVIMACIANVLIGMISWWLENKRPYSPEQMASWVIRFIANGYVRFSENQLVEPILDETARNS